MHYINRFYIKLNEIEDPQFPLRYRFPIHALKLGLLSSDLEQIVDDTYLKEDEPDPMSIGIMGSRRTRMAEIISDVKKQKETVALKQKELKQAYDL